MRRDRILPLGADYSYAVCQYVVDFTMHGREHAGWTGPTFDPADAAAAEAAEIEAHKNLDRCSQNHRVGTTPVEHILRLLTIRKVSTVEDIPPMWDQTG